MVDLQLFFRDLGVEECCRLFQGVPTRVLSVLLRRLPIEEAREFKRRLRETKEQSADIRHQARLNFLKLPLESSAEDFFLEVGLAVFARAIRADEKDWAELLVCKLSPRHGYLLRRLIAETQGLDESEKNLAQESLVVHFAQLMKEGRTEQTYWSERPEDEVTKVLEEEAA